MCGYSYCLRKGWRRPASGYLYFIFAILRIPTVVERAIMSKKCKISGEPLWCKLAEAHRLSPFETMP